MGVRCSGGIKLLSLNTTGVAILAAVVLVLACHTNAAAQHAFELHPQEHPEAPERFGYVAVLEMQRTCSASGAERYQPGPDPFRCLLPGSLLGTVSGMIVGGFAVGIAAAVAGAGEADPGVAAVLVGAPLGGAFGSALGTWVFSGRDGQPSRDRVLTGAGIGFLAATGVSTLIASNSDDTGGRTAAILVSHITLQSVITSLFSANR